jgi:predicted transcriptional regulator
MGNELSDGLRDFIKQYITSLEKLEILLLLYQEANRSWSVEEVFKVTQTNLVSVADRLKSLAASGLLIAEGNTASVFRFQPMSAELAQRVSELQEAYAFSKYKVVEAIFSTPHGQAQKFADSFKLKRKE